MGGLITIGDSLTMPRPGKLLAAVKPQECWPFMISRDLGFDWHWHLGQRGASSKDVLKLLVRVLDYVNADECNLVVLQFGVVDCTPRPFPRFFPRLITATRLEAVSPGIAEKLNRARLLYRLWGRPWVAERQFRKNLAVMVGLLEAKGLDFLFIEIAPPGGYLLENVGRSNNERYNLAFREALHSSVRGKLLSYQADLMRDGYHLTAKGHQLLRSALADFLRPSA